MNRPLLWFVASWIAGYMAAVTWPLLRPPIWLTLTAAALAAGCWAAKLRRGTLLILPLLLASSGYYGWLDSRNTSALTKVSKDPDEFSGSTASVVGVIDSAVEVDGDHVSFTFAAHELRFNGQPPAKMKEKLQVSVRLASQPEQITASGWERTDELKLSGTLLLPETSRNFGGFDYREYLRRRHVHWLFAVKGAGNVELLPSEKKLGLPGLLLINDRLRAELSRRMDVIFPADQTGLMKSMLIGWQDEMNPVQYRQFSKLGLTHILAISGMNVAIFLGILFWILKRLRVTKETSLGIAIAAMPAYVLLTGASPSIVRAGLMAMIALYAQRRGLLKDGLHLAAAAAWIMLVWEPYYMYDVGFQLSFIITAALIIGVPRVTRLLPLRGNRLKQAIAITVVSQLVSFPVTITYFNGFSPLSWLANLLFVPIFGTVLFPAALITLLVGIGLAPFGRMLGICAGWLSRWTLIAINRLAEWGGYYLVWPTPSAAWISLYFAVITVLYAVVNRRIEASIQPAAAYMSRRSPGRWPIFATAGGFLLLIFYAYTPDRVGGSAWVEFIDVGQGDAALIRTPGRKFILVDGGGTMDYTKPGEEWRKRRDPFEIGRQVLVPLLKQRGVHELEYVIATHEDQDHIGGLQAVVEQIPIKHFMFNGTLKTDPKVQELFRTLLQKRIPLVAAQGTSVLNPDKNTQLAVLLPFGERQTDVRVSNQQNNESIVFLLQMSGYRYLFTGDMEQPSEQLLLQLLGGSQHVLPHQEDAYTVDVMKVAHHGSATSTSQAWLEYWKPAAAVISVGARNVYGHPAPQIVQRLEDEGAAVYRTDLQGAVRITTSPHGLVVRTKLKGTS